MAKATKETKIITPAVEEVSEITITLTLTQEEAQVLRDITGWAFALEDGTRRELTDNIYHALRRFTHNTILPRDFEGPVFHG